MVRHVRFYCSAHAPDGAKQRLLGEPTPSLGYRAKCARCRKDIRNDSNAIEAIALGVEYSVPHLGSRSVCHCGEQPVNDATTD